MNRTVCLAFYLVAVILSVGKIVNAQLKEGQCEVCVNVLNTFKKTLTDFTPKSIEKELFKHCEKLKGVEHRFCYIIGAIENAPTKMVNEVTKPLSFHKPVEKICEGLSKKDDHICELIYKKPVDWKNVNLKKMRVKELKNILSDWDETCENCLEKSEFIKRIEELKPQYVKDAKSEL